MSTVMKSVMPCTSAWLKRCATATGASGVPRHASLALSSRAAPFAFSAISIKRSPGLRCSSPSLYCGVRFSTTSSTRSRSTGSKSSYTPTMPALTMPMSIPAWIAWYKNTVCMASRTGSLPLNEKLTFDTPPLTFAPGKFCLIQRVASMKSTA